MVNRATLIGRLGADPEIRFMPDGKPVANLRLATDERWKDKNGEAQVKTEWHRVVIFGALAEVVQKFLAKGRLIYIEGRIQTRQWDDKEGQKHYTTEIVGTVMKMLDKSANGNGASNGNGAPPVGDPGYDGSMPEDDVPF